MLKGRFLKIKLWCFASLKCDENYECPLIKHCRQAHYDEVMTIPLYIYLKLQQTVEEKRANKAWRNRVK